MSGIRDSPARAGLQIPTLWLRSDLIYIGNGAVYNNRSTFDFSRNQYARHHHSGRVLDNVNRYDEKRVRT